MAALVDAGVWLGILGYWAFHYYIGIGDRSSGFSRLGDYLLPAAAVVHPISSVLHYLNPALLVDSESLVMRAGLTRQKHRFALDAVAGVTVMDRPGGVFELEVRAGDKSLSGEFETSTAFGDLVAEFQKRFPTTVAEGR